MATFDDFFLYPAADDAFERFDSCRTGIRDGRLNINPEQKDIKERIRSDRKKRFSVKFLLLPTNLAHHLAGNRVDGVKSGD